MAWWGRWDRALEGALVRRGGEAYGQGHDEGGGGGVGVGGGGGVKSGAGDDGGGMPLLHARAVAEGRIPLGQRLAALFALMDAPEEAGAPVTAPEEEGETPPWLRGGVLARRANGWGSSTRTPSAAGGCAAGGCAAGSRAQPRAQPWHGPWPLERETGCQFIPGAFGLEGG